jgi:hypothetical protein
VRDKREKLLLELLIGLTAVVFISTIFCTFILFAYIAIIAFFVIIAIGVAAEILVKLGRGDWLSYTERFKDGSELTDVKLIIVGTWGVGMTISMLCIFIIGALYS